MANPFEDKRERGTIVSWSGMGIGRIKADNGDRINLFYWSILQGFRQLTVGQRVEFSRAWLGLTRNTASRVVPVPPDAESD
jgi:cold shock CspA family protein